MSPNHDWITWKSIKIFQPLGGLFWSAPSWIWSIPTGRSFTTNPAVNVATLRWRVANGLWLAPSYSQVAQMTWENDRKWWQKGGGGSGKSMGSSHHEIHHVTLKFRPGFPVRFRCRRAPLPPPACTQVADGHSLAAADGLGGVSRVKHGDGPAVWKKIPKGKISYGHNSRANMKIIPKWLGLLLYSCSMAPALPQ